MDAARSSSRGRATRSTSVTSCSTMSCRPRPWGRGSATRRPPVPCGTSSHSGGCARRRPTPESVPSASTISRWSSSSGARSPTTSSTCCSIRPRSSSSMPKAWTGRPCSSRSPMPGSAMAASAAWLRASSTSWPPCSSRPWATGSATSTASSSRPSGMAGSTRSPTTGCAGPTLGRSPDRRRRSRSGSAARSRCAVAPWA